ncbi:MAG: hypothetical protein K9H64_14055 [Bacteroidales bacterium]|nr:hypothetical protein [Bacteroidales bacterium]
MRLTRYKLHFHVYRYILSYLLIGCFMLCGLVSFGQLRVSYLDKGKNELRKNNYVGAIEYLNYAIKQNDFYTSYFLRGVAKYSLGDYLGAENDYTECINRAPFHEDAILYRAVSRDRQFDFERALQDYSKAQELDSTDWRIYLNRSTLNLFLQNFELVVEDCNKALELKSKGEGAFVIRGMARTQLQQYD